MAQSGTSVRVTVAGPVAMSSPLSRHSRAEMPLPPLLSQPPRCNVDSTLLDCCASYFPTGPGGSISCHDEKFAPVTAPHFANCCFLCTETLNGSHVGKQSISARFLVCKYSLCFFQNHRRFICLYKTLKMCTKNKAPFSVVQATSLNCRVIVYK